MRRRREARRLGFDCTGPHSPDTIFIRGLRKEFDLIVAMYHDQGHIPMKLIDFERTVNISLGIPIIRTSVDHGTAFDIAGQDAPTAATCRRPCAWRRGWCRQVAPAIRGAHLCPPGGPLACAPSTSWSSAST